MSRCFPFPPPGYVLNGIRNEALIVSIKGAEEKAKKEQRRKERKRDKKDKKEKERKKDKKEKNDNKEKKDKKEKKRKEREGKEGGSEKHSHKRRRKEDPKDGPDQKADIFRKLKESENDSLEKSSLTVERELLQSMSQTSCDSTLNSNEIQLKQKEKQPLDGRHNNDSESIIRIRLPTQRQKDPEVMMTNKDQDQPCPSRRIALDTSQLATTKEPVNQHPCSTSAAEKHASKPCEERRKDPTFAAKLGKEKLTSSSTPATHQPKSLCSIRRPPSSVVQYLKLVENWVPNTIEERVDFTNSEDEECWWVTKKPSSYKFDAERCKQLNIDNEINQVSNSTVSWPRAHCLPEADIYALPYTVPF